MTLGQFFKRSLTGLNSEFSFAYTSCLTKAEEPSLPYYLPIAGGRIIGFIPFPRVLLLCEMQSVSSRIWTLVTLSISYDDNHYTTGTSNSNQLYATLTNYDLLSHHAYEKEGLGKYIKLNLKLISKMFSIQVYKIELHRIFVHRVRIRWIYTLERDKTPP